LACSGLTLEFTKERARINELAALGFGDSPANQLELFIGGADRPLWVTDPDGDRGPLFQVVILIEDDGSLDDPAGAQLHALIFAQMASGPYRPGAVSSCPYRASTLSNMDDPAPAIRGKRPLRQAQVKVEEVPGQAGWWRAGRLNLLQACARRSTIERWCGSIPK